MAHGRRYPAGYGPTGKQIHNTSISWQVECIDNAWVGQVTDDGDIVLSGKPKGTKEAAEISARALARQTKKGIRKATRRLLGTVK